MTFPAVDVDLDRHLGAFDKADRLAQIDGLIDGLQDWLSQLDGVVQTENGQTKRHLNSIYSAVGNEMYSMESLLEDLQWQLQN